MEKNIIKGYIYYSLKENSSYDDNLKREDYNNYSEFFENCGSLVFSGARVDIEEYALYRKFKAQKIYYCFKTGEILKTNFFNSSRGDILDISGIGDLNDNVKFAPCVIKKN